MVLHQAPTPTTIRRKTTTTAISKKTVKKSAKTTTKAVKKVVQKVAKVKKVAKKGNDRLTPRTITEYVENPFFAHAEEPEFVSSTVYFRWLQRAVKRGDMKAVKDYFKSKKCLKNGTDEAFSYSCAETASYWACKQDVKFAQEYFKMNWKMYSDDGYRPQEEPNLLQLVSKNISR